MDHRNELFKRIYSSKTSSDVEDLFYGIQCQKSPKVPFLFQRVTNNEPTGSEITSFTRLSETCLALQSSNDPDNNLASLLEDAFYDFSCENCERLLAGRYQCKFDGTIFQTFPLAIEHMASTHQKKLEKPFLTLREDMEQQYENIFTKLCYNEIIYYSPHTVSGVGVSVATEKKKKGKSSKISIDDSNNSMNNNNNNNNNSMNNSVNGLSGDISVPSVLAPDFSVSDKSIGLSNSSNNNNNNNNNTTLSGKKKKKDPTLPALEKEREEMRNTFPVDQFLPLTTSLFGKDFLISSSSSSSSNTTNTTPINTPNKIPSMNNNDSNSKKKEVSTSTQNTSPTPQSNPPATKPAKPDKRSTEKPPANTTTQKEEVKEKENPNTANNSASNNAATPKKLTKAERKLQQQAEDVVALEILDEVMDELFPKIAERSFQEVRKLEAKAREEALLQLKAEEEAKAVAQAEKERKALEKRVNRAVCKSECDSIIDEVLNSEYIDIVQEALEEMRKERELKEREMLILQANAQNLQNANMSSNFARTNAIYNHNLPQNQQQQQQQQTISHLSNLPNLSLPPHPLQTFHPQMAQTAYHYSPQIHHIHYRNGPPSPAVIQRFPAVPYPTVFSPYTTITPHIVTTQVPSMSFLQQQQQQQPQPQTAININPQSQTPLNSLPQERTWAMPSTVAKTLPVYNPSTPININTTTTTNTSTQNNYRSSGENLSSSEYSASTHKPITLADFIKFPIPSGNSDNKGQQTNNENSPSFDSNWNGESKSNDKGRSNKTEASIKAEENEKAEKVAKSPEPIVSNLNPYARSFVLPSTISPPTSPPAQFLISEMTSSNLSNSGSAANTPTKTRSLQSIPEDYGLDSDLCVVCSNILPSSIKKPEITAFFRDCVIANSGPPDYASKIHFLRQPGEYGFCFVQFESLIDLQRALTKNGNCIGDRVIEVTKALSPQVSETGQKFAFTVSTRNVSSLSTSPITTAINSPSSTDNMKKAPKSIPLLPPSVVSIESKQSTSLNISSANNLTNSLNSLNGSGGISNNDRKWENIETHTMMSSWSNMSINNTNVAPNVTNTSTYTSLLNPEQDDIFHPIERKHTSVIGTQISQTSRSPSSLKQLASISIASNTPNNINPFGNNPTNNINNSNPSSSISRFFPSTLFEKPHNGDTDDIREVGLETEENFSLGNLGTDFFLFDEEEDERVIKNNGNKMETFEASYSTQKSSKIPFIASNSKGNTTKKDIDVLGYNFIPK